jgi:hypothetical protein
MSYSIFIPPLASFRINFTKKAPVISMNSGLGFRGAFQLDARKSFKGLRLDE